MKKLPAFVFLLFSAALCYGQTISWFEVSASSELSDSTEVYSAKNLNDGTWRSWAEAASGNGVGESFTLAIMYDPETIAGFALKNGYGNLDLYRKNNRVKSFKIYIDGNYSETIAVKDSISFEQYAFKKTVECKQVRFVIDSVYPGTTYNDTCVAEVTLLKEIINDREFYDNILFRLGHTGIDGPMEFRSHDYGRITSVSDPEKIPL